MSYNLYLNSFIESVNNIKPITIEEWKKEWGQIETIIRAMNLSLPDYETDLEEINQRLEKGEYVGHHSKIYEETYDPHYRIISRSIYEAKIKPLINKQ